MQLSRRHFIQAGLAGTALGLSGCSNFSLSSQEQAQANVSKGPLALNFNENPLGMPSSAREAIMQHMGEAHLYPDSARQALLKRLASYHGVSQELLIYGNGSSEVLKFAIDAMASAHCQLVMPKPTFDIVADYAKARGLKVTEVPLTAELQTDIAAMQAAVAAYPGPSIVYLCNPNNPTGLLLPKAPVAQWLAKASPELQFIIDEAYGEYAGSDFQSALPFIQNGQKHTVLTKTFSKAWGMAGLRAGYAIAAPEMIAAMQAQASFDNANLFALYGAAAVLDDSAWLAQTRSNNLEAGAIIIATLKLLGLDYLPLNASFIFHRIKGNNEDYRKRMQQAGILVGRTFPGLEGWNRLTLGTPMQMQQVAKEMQRLRLEGLL
ncbi:pyridoxal phosphate-dependent aminotransferase [Shewanella algae]|uniref:pyridoxal phosphate-dependent aminotransferase n=1 Tax=Shewanella algae TaxID=38313 RepID=UPI001AACA7BA|nr:histidinol-phosphate transaminase [Shewanella algae]MBO2625558.1 histidinol-phosphate aminotransferase family protein [Shewanella algae]